MYRISSNLTNDNAQYHMRMREHRMNHTQEQIASQSRIQNLRDAPLSAAHSTRYESYLTRLERYADNAQYAKDKHETAEGYVRQQLDMLQRIRELAVQGAHGTYAREDLAAMGAEVDELLREMVEVANAKDGDGTAIFAGTRTASQAFRAVYGNVPGADRELITDVEYLGNIDSKMAEVSEGSLVSLNNPGNRLFWAENQTVASEVEATGYQVQQDSTVYIDNEEIRLTEGDNINSIIAKINDSGAAVRARLDPVMDSLVLESTSPHQIWVEDGENSSVMGDLGILDEQGGRPPQNYASDARVSGGSLFDMVIALRDNLFEGDQEQIGSGVLRGIDQGFDNLNGNLGRIGAQTARLEHTYRRLAHEKPVYQDRLSNERDIDMAEAITDLRMLEHTHRAATAVAARTIQPTLLDFLR